MTSNEDQDEPLVPETVHEHQPVPHGERRSRRGGRQSCIGDPATRNAILNHIRDVGWHTPSVAAIAGVRTQSLLEALKKDPEFDLEIQQARAVFLAKLEREATRRAVEGWNVPVTVAGQPDVARKFSDALLLHLLKKSAPDKHGDKLEVKQHTTVDNAQRASEKFDMGRLSHDERAQLRGLLAKARISDEPALPGPSE